MSEDERVWIARDYLKCSGCRRCEIVCSLSHENKIWPEASRVRVFMLLPGVEIGVPSSSELKRLGLNDVDRRLEETRQNL